MCAKWIKYLTQFFPQIKCIKCVLEVVDTEKIICKFRNCEGMRFIHFLADFGNIFGIKFSAIDVNCPK